MSKIKLSLAVPETVKHTITLILPSGDEADLSIDYIYRDKREFAVYLDEQTKKAEKIESDNKKKSDKSAKRTRSQVHDETMKENVSEVLAIARGWDLDDDFNAQNIEAFENKYPGALISIVQGYFSALQGVRIKN